MKKEILYLNLLSIILDPRKQKLQLSILYLFSLVALHFLINTNHMFDRRYKAILAFLFLGFSALKKKTPRFK